ncbi:MAG: SMC-Scp complex subunit ScpB [Hyphomicrobiaceae bacterium]|nr:SMC-Scp complex subunit ScpB [Hyphomicrobiaceae bacterium]
MEPKLSVCAAPEAGLDPQADNDADGPKGAALRPEPTGSGLPAGVAALPSADRRSSLRIVEALLFAASEPLDEVFLGRHLKSGADVAALLEELKGFYAGRGVNLVRVAGKWAFRTAEDLGYLLERHAVEERRLSKAALETLAIIAYHQPVTRAEIEEIRGVETSKGTVDILLETGWVRPRGRRRAPGKPITFGTTEAFLDHFSLESIKDLPGLADLKGAGLLDATLPPDFKVPEPTDVAALMPDELPLDDAAEAEQTELDLGLPAGDDDGEGDGGPR